MNTYKIRTGRGAELEVEPTVGKWYCGITIDDDGEHITGMLGEYVGEGEFYDEDWQETGKQVEMGYYDYLQEQR